MLKVRSGNVHKWCPFFLGGGDKNDPKISDIINGLALLWRNCNENTKDSAWIFFIIIPYEFLKNGYKKKVFSNLEHVNRWLIIIKHFNYLTIQPFALKHRIMMKTRCEKKPLVNSSFIDFIELVLSGIGIQFLFLTLGLFGTQG